MKAYKLAQPNGFDFHTGRTIQYRGLSYPHKIQVPNADATKGICSSGVGHASLNPNDCFQGAHLPCSAYELEFAPVCGDYTKYGWVEAIVLREIDPAELFSWRYTDAIKPFHPLRDGQGAVDDEALALLKQWASVRASVRDSLWTYLGWIFAPAIPQWQENYPYLACVDLWHRGFVPSFDGKLWRLHAGPSAKIVWSGNP